MDTVLARRRSLLALAGASALGAVLPSRDALASPLTPSDRERLAAGEVVRVPLDLQLKQGDYFGGISYAVIPAPVVDVARVLDDPTNYRHLLPLTLDARLVRQNGRDKEVFLRQGGRAGSAAYVILVRRESLGLWRFWLDPKEPHDIADLWGYVRVQPWGGDASLLTYAALVRLDFGIVKLLFSEKIRSYALSTPGVVRAYLASHPVVHAPGPAGDEREKVGVDAHRASEPGAPPGG